MTIEWGHATPVALTICLIALTGMIYDCYRRWYKVRPLPKMAFIQFYAFFVGFGTITVDTLGLIPDTTKFWIPALIVATIGGGITCLSKVVWSAVRANGGRNSP